MKFLLTPVLLAFCFAGSAQPKHYTVANAHAHNDYVHPQPFTTAYGEAFGSIEVDIFLLHDSLLVGHEFTDTKLKRTIQNLYLNPLLGKVKLNNGYPYADSSRNLQILVDIKTSAMPTLSKLVEVLKSYPALINQPKIHFTITGNRPADSLFTSYPAFIWFDGELYKNYSSAALTRIVMMSDDFESYAKWNGSGVLEGKDKEAVYAGIEKAHKLGKPVRFWDAPDDENAWRQFMQAGVDYLNTDKLKELSAFLRAQ